MADLHGVAQPRIALDRGATVILQTLGTALRTGTSSLAILGQQLEEMAEPCFVELHVGRELPQERPQFVPSSSGPEA